MEGLESDSIHSRVFQMSTKEIGQKIADYLYALDQYKFDKPRRTQTGFCFPGDLILDGELVKTQTSLTIRLIYEYRTQDLPEDSYIVDFPEA